MNKGMEIMIMSLLGMVGIKKEQIQQIADETIPKLMEAAQTVTEFKNTLDELRKGQEDILAMLRANLPKAEVLKIEDHNDARRHG